MAYTLAKHISRRNHLPLKRVFDVLIIIIAIPVSMLTAACILIYFGVLRLRSLWANETESEDETYHAEFELVKNSHLTIILVEDEHDTGLTRLNDDWTREVYREQTCLYRIKTTPLVPALENQVGCFYRKEQPQADIIQLVDDAMYTLEGKLNTRLVLIQYPALEVQYLGDVGPFFLYNDTKDPDLIRGINEKEKIELKLVMS